MHLNSKESRLSKVSTGHPVSTAVLKSVSSGSRVFYSFLGYCSDFPDNCHFYSCLCLQNHPLNCHQVCSPKNPNYIFYFALLKNIPWLTNAKKKNVRVPQHRQHAGLLVGFSITFCSCAEPVQLSVWSSQHSVLSPPEWVTQPTISKLSPITTPSSPSYSQLSWQFCQIFH